MLVSDYVAMVFKFLSVFGFYFMIPFSRVLRLVGITLVCVRTNPIQPVLLSRLGSTIVYTFLLR